MVFLQMWTLSCIRGSNPLTQTAYSSFLYQTTYDVDPPSTITTEITGTILLVILLHLLDHT